MKQEIKDFFRYNYGWLIFDTLLTLVFFWMIGFPWALLLGAANYGSTILLWHFYGRNDLEFKRFHDEVYRARKEAKE